MALPVELHVFPCFRCVWIIARKHLVKFAEVFYVAHALDHRLDQIAGIAAQDLKPGSIGAVYFHRLGVKQFVQAFVRDRKGQRLS